MVVFRCVALLLAFCFGLGGCSYSSQLSGDDVASVLVQEGSVSPDSEVLLLQLDGLDKEQVESKLEERKQAILRCLALSSKLSALGEFVKCKEEYLLKNRSRLKKQCCVLSGLEQLVINTRDDLSVVENEAVSLGRQLTCVTSENASLDRQLCSLSGKLSK